MFKSILFFLLFISFSLCGFSQNYYPDKIYTKKGVIDCRITDIKDSLIFYRYKKQEWNMHAHARLDSIESYYWVSKDPKSDSLKKIPFKISISHIIGGGAQLLPRVLYGIYHDETYIRYQNPLPYIFYRFELSDRKENKLCLTLSGYERKGFGSHSGGSLAGGHEISGPFDFLRCDIGINWFWCFGKNKNTLFGIGNSFGYIPFIKAEMTSYTWSMYYGSSIKSAPTYDAISQINFSLNFEFNQQIKLSNHSALIIGIRNHFETPDGFLGASSGPYILLPRATRVLTAFIAFRFGKKPKEKIQS